MLNVMDLFCGTGGFSKGFENAGGYRVVYGIDVLPDSIETFKLNHRDAYAVHGDIRRVRVSEVVDRLPVGRDDISIVIGGPPCQGFSSLRPFRSSDEDDPRNSLFEQFASYVNYFRPPVFVFENVVGLATHKNGAALDAIQVAFEQLGYTTDWRILNAAHFGVPQKRERLILLGAQAGIPIRFPEPTHSGKFKTIGLRDASRLLRPVTSNDPTLFNEPKLPPALTVEDAIGDLPPVASGEQASEYVAPPQNDFQAARRRGSKALTMHESTRHTPKMMEIIRHSGPNISSIPKHLITSGFSSCYSRLAADEPAVTITVNFVHPASNRCIHPTQDRALTPREGARLQSYDDTFQFFGDNRSKIAKQIGNAVPPLLGQAIADAVSAMLGATLQDAAS